MTEPERTACSDDPRFMREQNLCLFALSKNLEGRIGRAEGERRECQDPECGTLMTVQPLEFEARTNDPCNSRQGRSFDGALEVEDFVHVYDGDATERGFHSGEFRWRAKGTLVIGELSGVTNAGTLRGPDCGAAGSSAPTGCAWGNAPARTSQSRSWPAPWRGS